MFSESSSYCDRKVQRHFDELKFGCGVEET